MAHYKLTTLSFNISFLVQSWAKIVDSYLCFDAFCLVGASL